MFIPEVMLKVIKFLMKSERRDVRSIVIGKLRVTYMDELCKEAKRPAFYTKDRSSFLEAVFYKKFESFYKV